MRVWRVWTAAILSTLQSTTEATFHVQRMISYLFRIMDIIFDHGIIVDRDYLPCTLRGVDEVSQLPEQYVLDSFMSW